MRKKVINVSTTININLDAVATILAKRGLEPGGKAQRFMSSEIQRLSDPYAPFDNGILKSNVSMSLDGTQIIYNSPYAQRMWYGKVMVGNPLEATDKDIKFQGSPMRGKEWVTRAMIDRKQDVIDAVEKFVKGGSI